MTLAPPAPSRLVFLDWLRILAFALLVPYHVGMYYVGWSWHVKSPHAGSGPEPWMMLSSPWRMSLLFIVSGAATSLMLRRHAPDGRWLGTRLRRLGLPLLLGMALIVPPQPYFEAVQFHGYAGSYRDFLTLYFSGYGGFCRAGSGCLLLPTWNHLWFLPYLMLYTVLLWVMLRHWPGVLDRLAVRFAPLTRGPLLLALPVAALLSTRLLLRPMFAPTHALIDDVYLHAQYLPLFMLGAVLPRAATAWPAFEAQRWVALVAALAGWAVLIGDGPSAARAVGGSAAQWCAIVAAIGFAHRHLHRDGPWRRRLTNAVFPLYVLHQSVIVVGAVTLAPLHLPPGLEALVLVAGTFGICAVLVAVVSALRVLAPLRPWLGLPDLAAVHAGPAGAARDAVA